MTSNLENPCHICTEFLESMSRQQIGSLSLYRFLLLGKEMESYE